MNRLISDFTGEYRYIYSLNSNSNLYYRIIKVDNQTSSHKIWDENAGAFGAIGTVSWANSAISTASTNSKLTDNTLTVGGYLFEFDASIDEGVYDVLFYSSASPASTDTILLGRQAVVRGSEGIGFKIVGFNDL